MSTIQMVDLNNQYLNIKYQIDEAIQTVINSCSFINGPAVKEFRKALAEYNNIKNAVTCGNGTDALQIALMALGLEPDDEVILPVHTYVATAEVIALLRLKPVFVDVCPDRFTVDINQVEAKITTKTRAIVPVHLYGQCADMEPLMKLAIKYDLKVVEDTAQAIGADYRFSDGTLRKAGTTGTIGTTSFFPSKNLGCFGDGGAMFIEDDDLAEKAWLIANHGQKVKYYHDVVGCNSRLDTIQAAVLKVKLQYLDQYISARQELADYYDQCLASIQEIQIPSKFANSSHVYHQYTIKVTNRRDELKTFLAQAGIPAMIYYPVPLHLQKAYFHSDFREGSFPVTEHLSKTVLSLPMHTEMQEAQRAYIVEKIKEFFK